MKRSFFSIIILTLAGIVTTAHAAESYTVTVTMAADEKAVFATVESANTVQARARIGGTVAQLSVREGDRVERGQVVASVGDDKLVLQMGSLDAQIGGLKSQLAQLEDDLDRAEELFKSKVIPKARLDEARTATSVARDAYTARVADRSVIQQQLKEGNILAPTSGRVLAVPATTGMVILPGEPVATIAEENFVLRLRVPERHARYLEEGDTVRIDGMDIGRSGSLFGNIQLIYPLIEDGRVVADASVEGLSDYFVGERIRVWVSSGERAAIIVPASFVMTRFGIDYVRLRKAGAADESEVPVQRGRDAPQPDMPDGIEILSGLVAGDQLVLP